MVTPEACRGLSAYAALPCARKQRCRHVVNGERRSANRTRWADSGTVESTYDVDKDVPVDGSSLVPQEVLFATEELYDAFISIDCAAAFNLQRVQTAMCEERVGPHHFAGSTGYGHGDQGRAAYDQVLAKVMGTEACMARIGIASADHALACALFGQLRPGSHALFISQALGDDTEALLRGSLGSLEDWGVKCTVLDPFDEKLVTGDGKLDTGRISACIDVHSPDLVVLQRWRSPAVLHPSDPSMTSTNNHKAALCRGMFLTCSAIQVFTETVRAAYTVSQSSAALSREAASTVGAEGSTTSTGVPERASQAPIVVIDNRGGEFVEHIEPGAAGVDLVTGCLLGSLGGSIAPGGGYVCGRQELVEKACARFSAPGMSLNSGAVPGDTLRLMFQGLFMAPTMVGEAIKGSMLLRKVLSEANHDAVSPCIIRATPHHVGHINASPDVLHLPCAAACMDSLESMHAMIHAVKASAFMPAVETAASQMLVATATGGSAGNGESNGGELAGAAGGTRRAASRSYKVLHAGGSFIQGSSAQIGASGVACEPHFLMCFQGGVHWSHWVNVLSAFLMQLRN